MGALTSRVRVRIGWIAWALVAAGIAGAQQPLTIPQPTGLVNDFAHVLSPSSVQQMEQIAADVRAKSRGEIAVVTLPDIGDRAPSDVALQIGRQWKVGKIGNPGDPTRNAGAVILLVPKETNSTGRGQCFIATGSGTEGFITDAMSGTICREAIPFFQQQDYGSGLALVTYRTAQRFADEFKFQLDTTVQPASAQSMPASGGHRGGISPVALLFIFVILYLILSGLSRRGRGCGGGGCIPIFLPFGGGGGGFGGGGGWSGGGGGGFGGFGGGGGFSGGGGGSSW